MASITIGTASTGTSSTNLAGDTLVITAKIVDGGVTVWSGTYTTVVGASGTRVGWSIAIPQVLTSTSAYLNINYDDTTSGLSVTTSDSSTGYNTWQMQTISGTVLNDYVASEYLLSSSSVTVTVFDYLYSATISPAIVNINTSQSYSLSVSLGSGGSNSYTYQWYKNGSPISGETSSSYDILSNSAVSTNAYYCVVNDSTNGNSVQTNTVTVNVYSTIGLILTYSPTTLKVQIGQILEMDATVSGGTGNTSYSWLNSGSQLTVNGQDINGSVWLYQPSDTSLSGASIKVTVTDNGLTTPYSVSSSSFVIEVVSAMAVTLSPMTATIQSSSTQTFTATVTGGSGVYSYLWYKGGTSTGITTSTYVTPTGMTSGVHSIYCQVTDSNTYAVIVTQDALLTVTGGLSITVSSTGIEALAGNPFTLSVSVSGGSGGYTYQWYQNTNNATGGTTITDGTSASITEVLPATDSVMYYSVYVTDNSGQGNYSSVITVSVYAGIAVTITANKTLANNGDTITLTSNVVGGSGSYTYQWWENNAQISGATNATYSYTYSSGTQTFYVVVTDSTLNLTQMSNIITIQSASQTTGTIYDVNLTDSFSLTDVGLSSSHYQGNGGATGVNTGTIVSTDTLTIRLNGSIIKAWNIDLQRNVNQASQIVFDTVQSSNVGLGDKIEMGYRGAQVFYGYVYAINKLSTMVYEITAYDGMYGLAQSTALSGTILRENASLGVSGLINWLATQVGGIGTNITGTEISNVFGYNFGGNALQKLELMALAFDYVLTTDETNNLTLLNYSSANNVTLTENANGMLVQSKKFNPATEYGQWIVNANIDKTNTKVYGIYGNASPSRSIGEGWLLINSTDYSSGILNTLAENFYNVYYSGIWTVKIWCPTYYSITKLTSGNPSTYTIDFADGTNLAGMKLTNVEVMASSEQAGVILTFKSFDDTLLSFFDVIATQA